MKSSEASAEADAVLSGIEKEAEPDKMISFLQSRLNGFRDERAALLDRVDALVESRQEEHSLLWELKRSSEEVHTLQKALSDAHAFLFEERERLLTLQAENDELKIQELEDRKRIQHLLKLTAPYEEDVKFERGIRPEGITTRPPHTTGTATVRSGSTTIQAGSTTNAISDSYGIPGTAGSVGVSTKKGKQGSSLSSSLPAAKTERIMRTIYLPTANTDTLILRIESLQAQLMEHKQFAEDRIKALLEDRRIREKDGDEARAQMTARVDDFTERLSSTESLLQRITRELLNQRRLKEAAEAEAANVIHEANKRKQEAEDIIGKTEAKIDEAKKKIQEQSDEYIEKFRQELRDKEAEMVRIETVYASMKGAYEDRIADLENRNRRLQRANTQLEERRAMDVEGFTATITALRQKLKTVERKQLTMRLEERLDDEDRLDILMNRLGEPLPKAGKVVRTIGGKKGELIRKKARKGNNSRVKLSKKGVSILEEVGEIRDRLDGIGKVVNEL